MKITILILFTIYSSLVLAQFDNLGVNTNWNDGTITLLKEKNTLKGLVQNNDKLGLVKFRKHGDDDTKILSFPNKSILTMEYFDARMSSKRRFASLYFKNTETGEEGYELFEIINEFKHFALVTKTFQVSPLVKGYVGQNGQTYYDQVGYQQQEGIYFVNEEGIIELYLMISKTEREWEVFRIFKRKKAYVNESLIEKYTGRHWRAVKDFSKKQKLDKRSKSDLIELMDFYQKLEREESL